MRRLNLIYIHTHDSGRVFSPYGYKVPTAHIEAFAQEATLFRNAFAAAPTCSPSRAGLLTGRYPHETGMLGLCNRGFGLSDYRGHLASVLGEAGYNTALCGIQHEAAHFYRPEVGAEIIGYHQNITTPTPLKELADKRDWDRENCRRACGFIERYDREKPFFLSFGFYGTHRPYPPVAPDAGKRLRPPDGLPDLPEIRADFAGHCASLAQVDVCFGQLIAALKRSGQYENSIILFTTDHGVAFPFGKSTLADSGLGVALVMRVPGSPSMGAERNALVSHIDVLPTLCDLLGLPRPEGLQGQAFTHLLTGEADAPLRKEVFAEMNFHTSFEPARCIRTQRYKYVEYLDESYTGQNLSNINESSTKTLYLELGLAERVKPMKLLFDLLYDPGEKNNLAGQREYADLERSLRDRLFAWRRETGDPLLSDFPWQPGWVVNKNESRIPSSKNPGDYIEGHRPEKE